MTEHFDPELAITQVRGEFGEHGGVAPSIERSATFTLCAFDTVTALSSAAEGPAQHNTQRIAGRGRTPLGC